MSNPGTQHSPSPGAAGTRRRATWRLARLGVAVVATLMSAGVVHALADLAATSPAGVAVPAPTLPPLPVPAAPSPDPTPLVKIPPIPGVGGPPCVASQVSSKLTSPLCSARPLVCGHGAVASPPVCGQVLCVLSGSSSDVDSTDDSDVSSAPSSGPSSGTGSGMSSGTGSGASSGTGSGASSGTDSGTGSGTGSGAGSGTGSGAGSDTDSDTNSRGLEGVVDGLIDGLLGDPVQHVHDCVQH